MNECYQLHERPYKTSRTTHCEIEVAQRMPHNSLLKIKRNGNRTFYSIFTTMSLNENASKNMTTEWMTVASVVSECDMAFGVALI